MAIGLAPPRPPAGLLSNSRWNLVAFACALAANFVTIPFVVRWIGLPAFGRAGLVIAVCAPFALIGNVLGQAVVREMSSRIGRGNGEGAARTLAAALRLGLLGSMIGWLVLVAAGPWITAAMTGEPESSAPLRLAFAIAASGWLAQQLVLVLQGGAAARQNFRAIAQVAMFSATALIGCTLAVTYRLPSIEGYLGGMSLGLMLSLAAWVWVQRREAPPGAWRSGGRDESRALLQFGKWQGLAQLAGAFGNQIDRYALGALAPIAIVGQYNVANRLQEAAYVGVIKGGEVLFPHFGSLSDRGEAERAEFFQRASWIVGTFSAMLLVPLVPLAHAVLALWVGAEFARGTDSLLRTLVLGGLVGCGSNVFVYYAMGMGRNAPVAWISVGYSILTVGLTVLLIRAFGPLAAGGGLLVASVGRVAASVVVTRRLFFPGLSWNELCTSTVLPIVVGVGISLAAPWRNIDAIEGWLAIVVIYATLAAAVAAATIGLTVLSPGGRRIASLALASWRGGRA